MAAATHDPRAPWVVSMLGDLERLKQEMLERYEDGVAIDIAAWVARLPRYRDEILDYWIWLAGTPRLHEIDMTATPADDRIVDDFVRQTSLAVSLGPQWLNEAVDPDVVVDEEIGAQLGRLREKPFNPGGRAPKEFRRAVVYAWIVHTLSPQRQSVTRLAAQKVAYLLEQALAFGLFTEHEQKPRGPYDRKAKYRDAEPIAERSGWIRTQGANLEPLEVDDKFERYLRRYVRSLALAQRLVARLARLSDDQMETWATVAWAGRVLAGRATGITVDKVIEFLGSSAEWRAKLTHRNFTRESIAAALDRLSKLRLIRD
jgi:hypothetical protein